MTEETKNPEKKLFIDEDWKSQVEADKEAARRPAEAAKPDEAPSSPHAHGPLPPADLTFLVSTLYLQGVMALGLAPNPLTNKADVQLERAKHAIDLLDVLQRKTEGNRTPDESEELEAVLHQLRLAYIGAGEPGGQTGTT